MNFPIFSFPISMQRAKERLDTRSIRRLSSSPYFIKIDSLLLLALKIATSSTTALGSSIFGLPAQEDKKTRIGKA